MSTIQISISKFYNHPEYYGFMPLEVFNTLEIADLEGKKEANVPRDLFDKMISDYNKSK
jgi:hypothetical protein